jgi:trimeric autotransporter adhesin
VTVNLNLYFALRVNHGFTVCTFDPYTKFGKYAPTSRESRNGIQILTRCRLGGTMKSLVTKLHFFLCSLVVLSLLGVARAQTSNPGTATVPRLVRFGGNATDATGKPLTGTVGATFAIYKEQQGGAALWLETQNVTADKGGHYSALLGSSKADGLPLDFFASGEARWVGVTIAGQSEQPRVLLSSVPYAMKAGDAETLGGKPASAFLQLLQHGDNQAGVKPPALPTVHGSGTANTVPIFTAASTIGNSVITQSGANVGIGKSSPAATLDVNGTANFSGLVSFASGQTFPGAGTVTSVGMTAPSADFTVIGSPITKSGTLGLNWTVAPTSADTANAIVKRDGSGNFSAGVVSASLFSAINGSFTSTLTVDTTDSQAIFAVSSNPDAIAINAGTTSTTGFGWGVLGETASSNAGSIGVFGRATFVNGAASGVQGLSGKNSVTGANANFARGVWGDTATTGGDGVLGTADDGAGVSAVNHSSTRPAMYAENKGAGPTIQVHDDNGDNGFIGDPGCGAGFIGLQLGQSGLSGCNNYTLLGANSGDTYLNSSGTGGIWIRNNNHNLVTIDHLGNMAVTGNLSKGGGSFKIDHPLDPANRYLYHSFVESPDMMNIYNGVVTLDSRGRATIQLPDYFEALNRDFRYQLTSIGAPGPNLYVAKEIANGHFKIAGGKAGTKVSWQVTGIRQDAWANAHRIPNEVEKPAEERGHYLHPELFGAPEELRAGSKAN